MLAAPDGMNVALPHDKTVGAAAFLGKWACGAWTILHVERASKMRNATTLRWIPVLVAVACVLLVTGTALAYEQYTTGRNDNNCAACHGGFRSTPYTELGTGTSWGDDLHDVHRNSMLSGDCATCHTGNKYPVYLGSSDGGYLFPALACAGCHGRAGDGTGAGTEGYGAGLRQHHWRTGTTLCGTCHTDADPAAFTPVREDEPPPYYASEGAAFHPSMPQDACSDPDNALTPEEDHVGSARGLDNDGDLDYDTADSDCGAVVSAPGEVSDPAAQMMRITSYDPVAMLMSLSYGNACDATGNAIIFGPLSNTGLYDYTGGDCSMGNSGTVTDWHYSLAPDSFFFLMVADNGSAEGSYGTDKVGLVNSERPSDDLLVPPACSLPQDLPNRCD